MRREEQLYEMAGRLVPYLKRADILDAAEDYGEYLDSCPEEPESPEAFAKGALGEGKRRYRRAWLAAVAAIAALVIWEVHSVRQYYRFDDIARYFAQLVGAVALPAALWSALGGHVLLPLSPVRSRIKRMALGLCAGLLVLGTAVWGWIGWLLVAVKADPERFSLRAIGWMGRDVLTCVTVLAAAAALWALWMVRRRSVWYFCTAVQALALALLCQGIWRYMSCMSLEFVAAPTLPVWFCAGPAAVATLVALALAAVIARGAGKARV